VGTGQCPVKRYNERLRDLIIAGRATPSLLTSPELRSSDPGCAAPESVSAPIPRVGVGLSSGT
jgi:glutathione-independent formaldehyde dehydrogenase